LDAQQERLTAVGASKVLSEKESGAKTDRAELAKLIKKLQANDMLIVTALDHFGQTLRDIINILNTITKILGSVAQLERRLIL
jgi:DNA invertase Pin-like site-specific DNA recombinase